MASSRAKPPAGAAICCSVGAFVTSTLSVFETKLKESVAMAETARNNITLLFIKISFTVGYVVLTSR